MKEYRLETLGMGVLAAIVLSLLIPGLSMSTAAVGRSCTMSFSGGLGSLQMSPLGDWRLASSNCSVTNQSGGITTGTFTGTFASGVVSGRVSGTWSVVGSIQKVTASSTDLMLSFSVENLPALGSTLQGMLSSTTSQPLLVVGTVGQINIS